MRLGLSRLHFPVTTLGPGRRIGIWFQGCSIRCPGCVSADTWGSSRGASTVARVLEMIEGWLGQADGVTISGGEPFDQPDALRALLAGIRSRTSVDVLVYSGYPIEHLREHLSGMNGIIDALISDPYDVNARHSLALRGSDNQRLHCLTTLGVERFAAFEREWRPEEAAFDLMVDENGSVWMVGIPRHGDMERLRDLLAAEGHEIVTSQATSSSSGRGRDE